MQIIEFKNESLNNIIKVPEQYKDYLGKPVTVILLPQDVTPTFSSDSKGVFLAAVAKWYELGFISQGKGAEITGLSREDFMLALSHLQVSPFQYTSEELEKELKNAS